MKIESFYPDIETSEKLNKLFTLPYNGQDWEIVNADDEKINDFIKYYLEAQDVQEKVTIFALLIASIDLLDNEAEITNALNRIKLKMKENLKYHLTTIIYWAMIGHGKDKEHIFMMTKYMREVLNEFMTIDKFEIKTPNIKGIEINGIDFLSLLGENQILKTFSELINFMIKESFPENKNIDLSKNAWISIEKENEFTHFEILNSIGYNYFKIRTNEFEKEIKKYNII